MGNNELSEPFHIRVIWRETQSVLSKTWYMGLLETTIPFWIRCAYRLGSVEDWQQ